MFEDELQLAIKAVLQLCNGFQFVYLRDFLERYQLFVIDFVVSHLLL